MVRIATKVVKNVYAAGIFRILLIDNGKLITLVPLGAMALR